MAVSTSSSRHSVLKSFSSKRSYRTLRRSRQRACGRGLPVFEGDELVERIKVGIDEHLRFAEAHADYIEVALTEPDITRIVADERIAMVLMLVSGYIADNLDVLKEFHELGIRVMCPSHWRLRRGPIQVRN